MNSKSERKIIEECRGSISKIDQDILALLKEREQLSATIGRAKRELNMPDRDIAREKAVFEKTIALAQELDLSVNFATALQELIIENSLSRQERDRIKTESLASKSILVVGGAGRLGQWLCSFFSDSGHKVCVLDKDKKDLAYEFCEHLDSEANNYDFIVVATPIRVSAEILAELFELNIKQPVIFDVSSLKTPVQEVLVKMARQGYKISSLHPMFGPSVNLLFGKHIIITSLGVKEADECAKQLFKNTALELIDMSIDEHDRHMAYLLSLSHLVTIIFAMTLRKSELTIATLEKLAAPTFSAVLSMARKVFDENPKLYYEIQALNPNNKNLFMNICEALKEIIEPVNDCHEDGFVRLMNLGREYLRK